MEWVGVGWDDYTRTFGEKSREKTTGRNEKRGNHKGTTRGTCAPPSSRARHPPPPPTTTALDRKNAVFSNLEVGSRSRGEEGEGGGGGGETTHTRAHTHTPIGPSLPSARFSLLVIYLKFFREEREGERKMRAAAVARITEETTGHHNCGERIRGVLGRFHSPCAPLRRPWPSPSPSRRCRGSPPWSRTAPA